MAVRFLLRTFGGAIGHSSEAMALGGGAALASLKRS